jgi:hypothetical protein
MVDELSRARDERDSALQQLAEARAELAALRLALARRGEPEPPLFPEGTAPDLPTPARYVVADALHRGLQRVLAPLKVLSVGSKHGR